MGTAGSILQVLAGIIQFMQRVVFDLLVNADRFSRSQRHDYKILRKVLYFFDLVYDLTDL